MANLSLAAQGVAQSQIRTKGNIHPMHFAGMGLSGIR